MEKRVVILLMILMTIMKFGYGKAELHYVGGGKSNWAPNINFSDWSSQQTFNLGDWLYFGFNKYQYNVLEVNKTSYENCIDKDFIKNITKGGRDVYQLTEPKIYYFLSGGGYCFSGMKVAVDVHGDRPTPAPAPATNRSSTAVPLAPSVSHAIFPLLLILALTSPLVFVDFLQYFS